MLTREEKVCPQCDGSGRRATARSANGRELERHERSGTPCDRCKGTGKGLAGHIAPGDVELLEAAGVPEFPEEVTSC